MRGLRLLVSGLIALSACAGLTQAPSPAVAPVPQPAVRTVPVPPGAHPLTKADVDAWLDGYMPYALRIGDIPGATIAVVKDGQIVTARGYGYADVARRAPVDPARTLFRPGSISKLFTWTAVMQLAEAGKLDLDGDVNAYLDYRIPPWHGQPITLRQIMTHTAGFEDAAKNTVFFDPKARLPLSEFLKRTLPKRIYAPGTTPAYSNYATALAGYIVQRVSGQPFDDYVDQHIFTPLGMRNTTFRQPLPPSLAGQMSQGYPRGSAKPEGFELVGPAPAGSVSTTATDMARFMIAHLQDGQLDGTRILRPETARMMHDSPLAKVDPLSLIPPLSRMELGFFETNTNGREVIGHLGDTDLFHSSLHLFLKDGVGLFFSFNSPGKAAAVGPLRTALFHDFADRYFPSTQHDGRVDPATAAAHARMMTGLWQGSGQAQGNFLSLFTSLLGQSRITVGPHGELTIPAVTTPGGAPRRWVEIAPFVWRDVDGHDRLAAKVIDGKVVRWSYDFLSPFDMFLRVPASRSSAWILPLTFASLAVLLVTFLYWPAGWYVRRRYAAPLAVTGSARQAYRATRIMAGLDVAVVFGWVLAMSALLGGGNNLTSAFDAILWLLQAAGLIVFVGAVPIAGWNMVTAWRDGRRWTRKLWSVLVFAATVMLLYVALAFGLIAMTVQY